MIDVEILTRSPMARRGKRMLAALIDAAPKAGFRPIVADKWSGRTHLLMTYGLGHPTTRPWTEEHKRRGGRVIGWDLGYWNRDVAMRLALDDDHPHRWIKPMLGSAPPDRWRAAGIKLREDFYEHGPIILCGMGGKSRRLEGWAPQQWEQNRLRALRARFPSRGILYRPKRHEPPLSGCGFALGAIEDAIRNASLLVCAHSNTAIDACIAGIPVECDDGAAFALYEGKPAPSRAERLAFLEACAYWQWAPSEASQAWAFIKERIQ